MAISVGLIASVLIGWRLAPTGSIELLSIEIEPIHEPASLYKLHLTISNGTSTRIEVGHRELQFETSEGEIKFQSAGPSNPRGIPKRDSGKLVFWYGNRSNPENLSCMRIEYRKVSSGIGRTLKQRWAMLRRGLPKVAFNPKHQFVLEKDVMVFDGEAIERALERGLEEKTLRETFEGPLPPR